MAEEDKFLKVELWKLSPEMLEWVKAYQSFNKLSKNIIGELKLAYKQDEKALLMDTLLGAEEQKKKLLKVLPEKKTLNLEGQISR